MSVESIIAARPAFGQHLQPYSKEVHVREYVSWLKRVLVPVDEPFFYHVVEQLLADQPEGIRLEVQSRIYQLIPKSDVKPQSLCNLCPFRGPRLHFVQRLRDTLGFLSQEVSDVERGTGCGQGEPVA